MVVAAVGSGRTRPSAQADDAVLPAHADPRRRRPAAPGRSKTPGRHRRKPGASTMFRVSAGSQSGGDRGQAREPSHSQPPGPAGHPEPLPPQERGPVAAPTPPRSASALERAANHRGDPRSGARDLSPALTPEPLSDRARQHLGPQSQSLFRSYGSNLPTSLTYISLSTRGSSPWRPAADMGTSQIGCSP